MATSTVKLYNVKFAKEQNCLLKYSEDGADIAFYLSTLTPVYTYTDFQYVKHRLDIEIKLPLGQSFKEAPTFNYVEIKNSDDTRTFYYYINDPITWCAQNTIKLNLSMDTLNTLRDLIVFGENTRIYREHKDRFLKPLVNDPTVAQTTRRIVDKVSENMPGLQKFVGSDTIIGNGKKWYLVYCNNQGINIGDTSTNDAINCYLIPEEDTTITGQGIGYHLTDIVPIPNSDSNNTILTTTGSVVTFTIGGTDYSYTITDAEKLWIMTGSAVGYYIISRWNVQTNTRTVLHSNLNGANVAVSFSTTTYSTAIVNMTYQNIPGYLGDYDVLDKKVYEYSSGSSLLMKSINKVNRTLSYLVKIIECPYPPIDINAAILDGTLIPTYTKELNSDGMWALVLSDLSTEFYNEVETEGLGTYYDITLPAISDPTFGTKDITRESKLYHSDYYNLNFVYDSFIKNLPLENIKAEHPGIQPRVTIDYKQTNSINSNLLWKFTFHDAIWSKIENRENYLVCSRNNEMPIYNSSYLDYIRTGYNYDKKAKNLQTRENIFSTLLSLGGAAASFGASAVTGGISAAAGISLATSAISNTVGIFTNRISAQNSIDQKLAEAKATTVSVSGSDDLNLMNEYIGNKMHRFTYTISQELKGQIYELFYKTGYASNRVGVPDLYSRYDFNFIQCEPDFTTKANPIWKDYIEDVKERFRLGVTYFHSFYDTTFAQTQENWERWRVRP